MEEESALPKTTSSTLQQSSPSATSSTLPPGCRFYPSEQQLLSYYLPRKNNNSDSTHEVIKDIVGFYNHNPYELPESACFRFGYRGQKRHWYFFTAAEGRDRVLRRAGVGFWKRKGSVKDVMCCSGKVLLGRRKGFIFYLDSSNNEGTKFVKTHWLLYEYTLLNNFKGSFVVCRVFVKSPRRNSICERGLSSCAEQSFATVRHIGIQHDGRTLSVLDEDKSHDLDYVNEKNAIEPRRFVGGTQQNNLVTTSQGFAACTNMLVVSMTVRHLISSIVEGDFLELDDLV